MLESRQEEKEDKYMWWEEFGDLSRHCYCC